VRSRLLALAAFAAAPLSAQVATDTGAHPIQLSEAIQLAVKNNPATVAARGNLLTSEAGVHSAWSAFIPSLTVNTSSSSLSPATSRVNTTTGQLISGKWQTTQGFNFALDLFDGGRRLFDISQARANLGAAVAGENAQNWQIAYLVKQQYYAVLAAIEERRDAQAALDQATQQMKMSVLMVQAKTAIKSDSLRSLIQVGNAQLGILTANNDLQTANAALTRLVATKVTVTAVADDTLGEPQLKADSAQIAQLALQGPAVQQAAASLQAAQSGAQAARSAWFPTISMSYGRNRVAADSEFSFSPGNYSYSGQLRFSASYPIFNQWQRESSIVSADVASMNADAALRDAKFAAQQSLVQYLGALQTAQEQITIQLVSVAAAEEDLRVQQQRYQLGAGTILDALTSQTTLNQARFSLIQARFNYRVAKAQLEALIGREL
jgi:outer membrane protein